MKTVHDVKKALDYDTMINVVHQHPRKWPRLQRWSSPEGEETSGTKCSLCADKGATDER